MNLPPSNAELAECLEDLARSDQFPRSLSDTTKAWNTEDVLAFSAASLRAQIPASFAQGMAECERGETLPMPDELPARLQAALDWMATFQDSDPDAKPMGVAYDSVVEAILEIARLRALFVQIRAINTREYDGGVDNHLIEEIVARGLS